MFEQTQYEQAIGQFQQAVYSDPKNPDGYYNLAATYHRMGNLGGRQADLDQAENYYNQCLDRDPEHREGYRGLAVLLVEEDRTEEAFRLMEGWVDRQPDSADAKIELARLFEEFGYQEAAREHLVEALSVAPDNARALAALGKIREATGEPGQALENYHRSLWVDRFQPEVAARVAALQSTVGPGTGAGPPASSGTRMVSRNPLPRR